MAKEVNELIQIEGVHVTTNADNAAGTYFSLKYE